MNRTHINQTGKQGFTLIELSIVLVIIGLIVGGVLIGQDLIKAAEVRAAIGQLEKYDAAANTFRTKYNGIPGDLANAASFGFDTTGIASTSLGNGLLNRTNNDGTSFDSEAAAFFDHLAFANMISEQITASDFTAANVDAIAAYVPTSKLGRGSLVVPAGLSGTNFFVLGVPTVTDGVLTFTDGTAIPVIDAFNIDGKLDDGVPVTGRVIAVTDIATADAGAAAADDICVNTDPTPDSYNMGTTARSNDTECTIRIRASF